MDNTSRRTADAIPKRPGRSDATGQFIRDARFDPNAQEKILSKSQITPPLQGRRNTERERANHVVPVLLGADSFASLVLSASDTLVYVLPWEMFGCQ